MNPAEWPLRLRIFLFFALIAGGALVLIGGALWAASERIGPGSAKDLVLMGGVASLGIVVLTGWVWQLFDEHIARPIQRLSGEMTASAAAVGARVGGGAARYLGDLGPAARRLSEALGAVREDGGARVAEAVGDVLAEKAQLEAVLRDLRECVLICNTRHEILLYNAEAQRLLSGEALGLGRSLLGLVTEQPVVHALDRLKKRFHSGRYRSHRDHLSVALVSATRDGARTLQGRLSLILDDAETRIDGFVATFHDATAHIAAEAQRDHLLRETLEDLRRPAAALAAAVEVLGAEPPLEANERSRFLGVLSEEATRLSRALEGLSAGYDELRAGGWSMNDVSTEALAACVEDRLSGAQAPALTHEGARHWAHCDSFTVVEMLALTVSALGREGVRSLTLSPEVGGAHVFLDLIWEGAPPEFTERDDWLDSPLTPALGTLSVSDVLSHHRSALWSDRLADGRQRLRLPLPPAVEDHESAPAPSLSARPEFYDFALLTREVPAEIGETRLDHAAFTVFDTETTGLFPSAGDEIVQIAGLRVLGGRIIRGECFERLVDPERRIPAASTRIHGIDDAMVAGAGTARTVLPAFHDFAQGSVLVAHNAPFDMKFLRLKEGVAGRRFDQPVLDTVLLSAWLFGQTTEHTLDALAERFGIAIPEERRHTAMADTEATAEVMVALIDVLKTRGVTTLAQALAVSEEAGAIRRRQSQY
ncbi:MAG: exonuclease domain-containing protein [Pseudomonadota bacterium]